MERSTVYAFITGLFLGRFTGIISNVILTSVVVYFIEPDFYSYNNLNSLKETVLNVLKK